MKKHTLSDAVHAEALDQMQSLLQTYDAVRGTVAALDPSHDDYTMLRARELTYGAMVSALAKLLAT
jgi:hypothetical protein